MKRKLLLALVSVLVLAPLAVHAGDGQAPFRFDLVPATPAIAACLPNASARITVFPKSETRGVDTLDVKAEGLPPNTDFVVFLTEKPAAGVPPFGAVQYIADFTTNGAGKGSVRVDAIILEAFSSSVCNGVRSHTELNHVTIWFADPAGDDVCFGPGGGPTTPFDEDKQAGSAVLSSNSFLPGAPLP
ncbi:MAG: hypothetical protein LC796_08810 [Acidobacteria bacterium]|nr:hypothetical protein [Acidobacteriota bacterium]